MEITTLENADPDYEIKELRLESIYCNAYLSRYKRLGYVEESRRNESQDGKRYTVIVLKRDKNSPVYAKLNEIEGEISDILGQEPTDGEITAKKAKTLKRALLIILFSGIGVLAVGVALLISGMFLSKLALALSGWGVIVLGAAAIIVWSFLRESWGLRKKDISDAAANPGFGRDEISRKVEEKLSDADKVRAGISAE